MLSVEIVIWHDNTRLSDHIYRVLHFFDSISNLSVHLLLCFANANHVLCALKNERLCLGNLLFIPKDIVLSTANALITYSRVDETTARHSVFIGPHQILTAYEYFNFFAEIVSNGYKS